MEGNSAGHIPRNRLAGTDQDIDLDGVRARLIVAPGETADHLAVWFPDARVLFPGDNLYHAFPNLHAIRDTSRRDFRARADSLGMLAGIGAEVLAPGHTMPVFGAGRVREVLTTTRLAILQVMRHRADGMNAGPPLDDIAASNRPPQRSDVLAPPEEFHGRASWPARAYATGTFGSYDGNPAKLEALSSAARAGQVAGLAGGTDRLSEAASNTDDLQSRLELCDHQMIAPGEPVQRLKADILEGLVESGVIATARNTILREAGRLRETEISE